MKRYTVIRRNKPPKHFNGYVQALLYYYKRRDHRRYPAIKIEDNHETYAAIIHNGETVWESRPLGDQHRKPQS